MPTITMNSNGRARKTLAEQIDRLDTILDGLAEALHESVAQAVREAVGLAVKAALTEALAHPELRKAMAPRPADATPPPAQPLVGPGSALRQPAARLVAWVCALGRGLRDAAVAAALRVRQLVTAGARGAAALARQTVTLARAGLRLLWRQRFRVLLALGAGGAVGLTCYLAGPLVSAAVSGLGGAAGTLANGRPGPRPQPARGPA